MNTIPPPPPPTNSSPSSDRRRFPIQPPTLTTAALPGQRHGLLHQGTPVTAISAPLPFSPAVGTPASAYPRDTSPMATRSASASMVSYNPSDWSRHGPPSGNYVPHATAAARRRAQGTQNVTGMEAAMPSPPPPYSPSPATAVATSSSSMFSRTSPHILAHAPMTSSPVAGNSEYSTSVSSARPANQQDPPSSFPPPPPNSQRDRSASRSRFNLGVLASRARTADASSPSNAMDTLQQQTAEAIARAPPSSFPLSVQPPGARRAASAGGARPFVVGTSSTDSHGAINPDGTPVNFGIALPGPPPGPPPGNRSQSANRATDRQQLGSSNPTLPLRLPMQRSQLGPVPPTPANWVDEELTTNGQTQSPPSEISEPSIVSSGSRDLVASRSIRERRSESRAKAARSGAGEPQTAIDPRPTPWGAEDDATGAKPANLVLSSSQMGALGRRRHVSKAKTSPLFTSPESPHFTRRKPDTRVTSPDDTVGPSSAPLQKVLNGAAPTPPISARSAGMSVEAAANGKLAAALRAKGLLTPETGRDFERPASALSGTTVDQPLSAQIREGLETPASARAYAHDRLSHLPADSRDFALASLSRFKTFIEAEAVADDDQERLELFANFIVTESRIRRDRYSASFDAMGSDVLELTRDLWRSMSGSKRSKTPTPVSAGGATASPATFSRTGYHTPMESPAPASTPGSAVSTPRTSQDSSNNSMVPGRDRSNSQRQNTYQPALSPILSMAMSTIPDDESSRGRAPSRWWEASVEGSVGGGRKVERTKRESKYMGVAREALQRDFDQQSPASAGPSHTIYQSLGADEYPPEKVGWHEETTPSRFTPELPSKAKKVASPRLDVSRLITLPPPYPRHHPAVNNSHPDLTTLRQSLRSVVERTYVSELRDAFEQPNEAESTEPVEERRRQMRRQIHDRVSQGTMSFADAAKAETEFEESEVQRKSNSAQKDFDNFQARVMSPLLAYYSERINTATVAMDQLREWLSDEARSIDPSLTQEAGDEKPEILEKLTLLKWIFEAREQLHKDIFNLESESDEMYKRVILTPYELSGAQDKISEVESFFSKDSCSRRVTHAKKAARRFESFLEIIEQNVTRGVELQLSAFWDIAPGLLAVVQQVPADLINFDVVIPADEFEDNPGYHDHPLQYLYSLMSHAEKSAYQFIESQTNLMCLLHEVKTGLMLAGCKLIETQREQAGEEAEALEQEMEGVRRDEDARLTRDLKEKVDIVDDQWKEALGTGLGECKARVKAFLEGQGGWIDELNE